MVPRGVGVRVCLKARPSPLPRCRGDSKAGPSLSCEEGEWVGRSTGSQPTGCRLEFQPCSAGLAGETTGQASGTRSETDPTPASFLSLGKRHIFRRLGLCSRRLYTFISDSRLSETDGLLAAWLCVCVCARVYACYRPTDRHVHRHMSGQALG